MTDQRVRQLRADTRTETAEMPATLFAALARFQADLPRILKGNTAKVPGKDGRQGYSYDYADLADVSDAVLKQLGALGLFFIAKPHHREGDGKFGLSYTLGHVSGEREDGWWELRSDLPMQQMGGMITYARRYTLLAVTGAHPDGEDDDAASTQNVASRQTAGDAWESAAPAPPRQDDGPYKRMLAAARTITTEAAEKALAREADTAKRRSLLTREQCDHILNAARGRLESLRETARPVEVADLAMAAQDAAEGSQEPAPPPQEPPGDARHKRLIGAVQGHFKRLGFTDDDRAERLWAAGKLARVKELQSLNDLDPAELKDVANALGKCRDRERLESLLALTGEDGDGDD